MERFKLLKISPMFVLPRLLRRECCHFLEFFQNTWGKIRFESFSCSFVSQ